ncbi:MAG: hypothetical protein ACKVXR_14475 [Planctomycetota bacterium]
MTTVVRTILGSTGSGRWPGLVALGWLACTALACGEGTIEPSEDARAASLEPGWTPEARPRAETWILAIRTETQASGLGTAEAYAACELALPERGDFRGRAVLRSIETPRYLGGCTLLSSTGDDEIPLVLDGIREDDRIRLRESSEAREIVQTMDCDGLVLNSSTLVPASEHEFEMRLRDGETHEYRPTGARPDWKVVVRYTLQSRAFVDARVRSRPAGRPPIEVCAPSTAARAAIRVALEAKDFGSAIDLASRALGLERLGPRFSVEFDPSIVDPDVFGRTREDEDGGIRIRIGPSAIRDAPILLSTLLHEAVGHAVLGLSEHDPEYPSRFEVEEIEALHLEAVSAAMLGLSEEQLSLVCDALARRRAALRGRHPERDEELGQHLDAAPLLTWISCEGR